MKRRMKLFLIAVTPLVTAAACGPEADPLAVDSTPSFSTVDACLAVSGTLEETFLGADIPNFLFFFGGSTTGDLVGTTFTELTAPDNPAGDPPGPITFGAGTRTFTVTGGGLEGAVLRFAVETFGRQDPPIAHDHTRMTLISGARSGHLNLRGTFDWPTETLTATYRGSVCR